MQAKKNDNTSITWVFCDPCCDFARPMLRLCAMHVAATLLDPCCDFALPKLAILRFCATHVATLRDPNWLCCNFLLLKSLAGWWNFGYRKTSSATHFGRNMSRGPRLRVFVHNLIQWSIPRLEEIYPVLPLWLNPLMNWGLSTPMNAVFEYDFWLSFSVGRLKISSCIADPFCSLIIFFSRCFEFVLILLASSKLIFLKEVCKNSRSLPYQLLSLNFDIFSSYWCIHFNMIPVISDISIWLSKLSKKDFVSNFLLKTYEFYQHRSLVFIHYNFNLVKLQVCSSTDVPKRILHSYRSLIEFTPPLLRYASTSSEF